MKVVKIFHEIVGPDSIPVVVLKNCEPEPSYILAEHFKSCFPDCWKVSSVVPVFIKNVGERSTATGLPVNLLSMVSKVFRNFKYEDC